MTDLDGLHEIVDVLTPRQVRALLALLETEQPVSDEEFAHRLAEAPEEDDDQETVARVVAAETKQGESISHDAVKQRLGL